MMEVGLIWAIRRAEGNRDCCLTEHIAVRSQIGELIDCGLMQEEGWKTLTTL